MIESTHYITAEQRKKFSRCFPRLLHFVLCEVEKLNLEHIISWAPDGREFCIHHEDLFLTEVAPHFFSKQTKIRSFYRQLNLWGFQRSGESRSSIWKRDLFARDEPEKIKQIKRNEQPASKTGNTKGQRKAAEKTSKEIKAEEKLVPPSSTGAKVVLSSSAACNNKKLNAVEATSASSIIVKDAAKTMSSEILNTILKKQPEKKKTLPRRKLPTRVSSSSIYSLERSDDLNYGLKDVKGEDEANCDDDVMNPIVDYQSTSPAPVLPMPPLRSTHSGNLPDFDTFMSSIMDDDDSDNDMIDFDASFRRVSDPSPMDFEQAMNLDIEASSSFLDDFSEHFEESASAVDFEIVFEEGLKNVLP